MHQHHVQPVHGLPAKHGPPVSPPPPSSSAGVPARCRTPRPGTLARASRPSCAPELRARSSGRRAKATAQSARLGQLLRRKKNQKNHLGRNMEFGGGTFFRSAPRGEVLALALVSRSLGSVLRFGRQIALLVVGCLGRVNLVNWVARLSVRASFSLLPPGARRTGEVGLRSSICSLHMHA